MNHAEELGVVIKSLDSLADKVASIVTKPSSLIITNKQLCEKLNVCSKTVQKWRDNGLITYSKIGREIFYKYSDVLAMLDDHKVESCTSQ